MGNGGYCADVVVMICVDFEFRKSHEDMSVR